MTDPGDVDARGHRVEPPSRPRGLTTERILLVPQGSLLELPFEVLVAPDGHYLIERWETAYAPNATEAVRSLQRSARPDGSGVPRVVPVVGSGLGGPHDPEIAAIAAQVGSEQLAPANDRRLPREALLSTMAGADILHLNAHGIFETVGDPLLSRLQGVVSGTAFGDFTAADFVAVKPHSPDVRRLVVLSSCEGGRVRRRISNEIYGFAWSLLVSGVPNAVVARWRLEPAENAAWMGQFYAGIAAGQGPAAAAAAAMRALRDRAPRQWAAMQVIGG